MIRMKLLQQKVRNPLLLLTVLTKPTAATVPPFHGYRHALGKTVWTISSRPSIPTVRPIRRSSKKFSQIREGYDAIFENRTPRRRLSALSWKSAVRGARESISTWVRPKAGCKCPVPSDENRLRGRDPPLMPENYTCRTHCDLPSSVFSPENPFHPDQLAASGRNKFHQHPQVKL